MSGPAGDGSYSDGSYSDGEGSWPAYARALAELHRERDAAVRAVRAARDVEATRSAELTALAGRLTEQQRELVALATRLRVPLGPTDLTQGATPAPQVGPEHAADHEDGEPAGLRALVDAGDQALAEAHRVAALPQFLPAWTSPFARAAVIYAALAIPSLLLTVFLSLADVGGDPVVFVWFAVVWPAVTAVVGGIVVGLVGRPRVSEGPPAPVPRHRWFGVVVAWASWLVPGAVLDRLGSLWPG